MKNKKDSNRKNENISERGSDSFIQKILVSGNILGMEYKDLDIKLQM